MDVGNLSKSSSPGVPVAAYIGVGMLALVLRLWFVGGVIHQNAPEGIQNFNADSPAYLRLAHNLQRGKYVTNTAESHHDGLLRTPGYPFICAILGASPGVILWSQAILGTILPLVVMRLAMHIFHKPTAAIVCGLFAAISPSGIGLSGMILVDLVFGLTFVAGFVLLYRGASIGNGGLMFLAGLVFAVAVMIKPTLILWPAASLLVAALVARGSGAGLRWHHAALCILPQIVVIVGWSTRNYVSDRLFTFSTIDTQNVRHFVAPQLQEWNLAGRSPDDEDVKRNQERIDQRDTKDLTLARTTTTIAAKVIRRQRTEGLDILQGHRIRMIGLWAHNVAATLTSRFGFITTELPQSSSIRGIVLGLESIVFSIPVRILAVMLVIAGYVLTFMRRGIGDGRRRWYALLALGLTFCYFAVFTGTTFSVGWRVIYPAEFALVMLIVAGMTGPSADMDDDMDDLDEPRRRLV